MSRSGSSNNIFQILEDSERRKSVDASVAQSDIQGNAPEDVEPEEPNVKELSEEECKEEFEKKVKSLFEVREVDELIDDLKKLNAPQYHDSLLEVLLNLAFDRKESEVELVVKFLEKAISEDVIQANNIVAALNNIMEVYTDIVMDVPKLPNLMGLLLSSLLSADILEVKTVKPYIIQLSSQGLIPPSIKLGCKIVQGLLQQSWVRLLLSRNVINSSFVLNSSLPNSPGCRPD
ncbi:armadillo-type protein [Paraphysoderma sedebokerense]|nr:armadillo-type protein [Paraphysoderma sedebokerense]